MTACEHLPNHRASETFSFVWLGMRFTAPVSRFHDGRLAEIFLTNEKVNSQAFTPHASFRATHFNTSLEQYGARLLRHPQGLASVRSAPRSI